MLAIGQLAPFNGRARTAALTGGVAAALGAAVLASHLVFGGDILSPTVARLLFPPLAISGVTSIAIATALSLFLLGLAAKPFRQTELAQAISSLR